MSDQNTRSRRLGREAAGWRDGEDPGLGAGLVAAVTIVVLIVLCGVVVGVNALRSEASATTGGDVSASACGLTDTGAASGAPSAEWAVDRSSMMAAPYSEAYGPAVTSPAGVHSCFAPGETGAVFAAAHFLLDSQSPAISDEALASRVVDDKFKQDLVASFVDRPETPQAGELVGFWVVDSDESQATVELVWRVTAGAAAGALGATPLDLTWVDGDWLIDGTSAAASTTSLSSMQGYIEWRAP